jgi:hypothetical protein
MQNEKLKQKLEQVAISNGIHSLEWLGGSLYVKFQGSLPIIKADKTHIALRKIMKANDTDSGVNMYSLPNNEYVYDFVPADAEAPYVDYSGEHIPQEIDTMINLENEIALGK